MRIKIGSVYRSLVEISIGKHHQSADQKQWMATAYGNSCTGTPTRNFVIAAGTGDTPELALKALMDSVEIMEE